MSGKQGIEHGVKNLSEKFLLYALCSMLYASRNLQSEIIKVSLLGSEQAILELSGLALHCLSANKVLK